MSTEPQTALPRPGEIVAGRFRVERTLGLGGMGGVFAAQDLARGTRVALKLMLPHLTSSPEFVGRFAREATAASALHTPHVAKVYEVGQTPEGAPFIVMELLEGRDLDQTVRARGSLPIAEAVGFVLEACHAVAEAHARGIVHRDLKPSNLFVADVGGRTTLKVLDFGISKTTPIDGAAGDGLTATDSTLGSPQYMSPEQLRNTKRVDHRTDIWSLGIILQKLLTGRLPYQADSIGEHLMMIVSDPPTPLRVNRPDAPAELERVVLRCLQKDLALRFQNVGQLAVGLAPFADASHGPLVDAIAATTGRDAAFAPLAPLPDPDPDPDALTNVALAPQPSPDAGTVPGWTPTRTAAPPRRSLYVGASLAALAALGIGVAVSSRRAPPTPSASSTGAVSAEVSPAPPSATVAAEPSTASTHVDTAPPPEPHITLETDPKDAEVEVDGVVVGDSPVRLPKREKAYRVVVRAAGYLPETREVTSTSDAALRVVLRKARGARKGKVLLETDL